MVAFNRLSTNLIDWCSWHQTPVLAREEPLKRNGDADAKSCLISRIAELLFNGLRYFF